MTTLDASAGTVVVTGSDVTDRRWWLYSKAFLLLCEGQFGERAYINNPDLPQLNVEVRAGSHYAEKFPTLSAEGTTIDGASGRLSSVFPELKLDIRMPHGVASVKFPEVEIVAAASTSATSTLSRKLPWISSSGSLSGGTVSLDKVLCVLKITASVTTTSVGNLNSKLPGLKGRVKVLSGSASGLSSVLPELQSEAISNSAIISLAAYLPVITPGLVSGEASGLANNTMTNEDRFDNTLLRYKRWA